MLAWRRFHNYAPFPHGSFRIWLFVYQRIVYRIVPLSISPSLLAVLGSGNCYKESRLPTLRVSERTTMKSFITTLAVLLLQSALVVQGEISINCKGSSQCGVFDTNLKSLLEECGKHIDPSAIYLQGSKVLCKVNDGAAILGAGLCLFPQKAAVRPREGLFDGIIPLKNDTSRRGINGSLILDGLRKLVDKNCPRCGSVPIASDMLLTSNYVLDPSSCRQIGNTDVCQPDITGTDSVNPYFNETNAETAT